MVLKYIFYFNTTRHLIENDMYVYVSHRNAAVCTFTPKLLYALPLLVCSKQHACVKQDMCL